VSGKNVNLGFAPVAEESVGGTKPKKGSSGTNSNTFSGLVTPVNSTEVTPPGAFAPTTAPSQQGLFDTNMYEGGTPSAMQVDPERGSEWEWWTMVM
jgi:hypothetical protein